MLTLTIRNTLYTRHELGKEAQCVRLAYSVESNHPLQRLVNRDCMCIRVVEQILGNACTRHEEHKEQPIQKVVTW